MKKTKRSAFTIVELVIVIAVIAILSAVLIPTFGSIIDTANRSVDTVLVSNINTILMVEDILGDGVNDAVEIQKVIKENGLKLETKSKGQYIWYDIENKKVVLGGLDENGIVLSDSTSGDSETANVEVSGPALISDTNVVTETTKGKFNADTTAPENFIEGYLFLSTESADGLAEAIYALRNPEGATSDEVKASLNETLGKIDNANLKSNLTAMLSTTAVMTKGGVTGFIGDSNTSVTRVIVSSEMTNIYTSTIETVLKYPNVVAVDFHSGVVSADPEAVTVLKNRTEKPYFVYSGDELKKVDADNGDVAFLIHKDERGQYIKSVYVVNVITGDKQSITEFDEYTFSYNLSYVYKPGTATESYDFVGYSFYEDGSLPLELGEHTYTLNSTEKLLIDSQGNLTIYLVYNRAATDFKINGEYYSSKTTTRKLAKGEITSGTITVVSTNAVLDDSFGAELTIPSDVTLHLPYYTGTGDSKVYSTSTAAKTGDNINNSNPDNDTDKLTIDGHTKLTIAKGVTLNNAGTIYVDAVLYGKSGDPNQCYIRDNCGVLQLANGSTLNTTGDIYAYGVIRGVNDQGAGVNGTGVEGEGEIIATSGTITEIFTVRDWHGGVNAKACIDNYATPFNDWLIDNIRAKMTIYTGVEYTTFGSVYVSGNNAINFELLNSSGNGSPLFTMGTEAIVQKTYDDGFNMTILQGALNDNAKEISVSVATVKFSQVALPLPNFDITIKAGASLTLDKNLYKVLPGSEILVEEAKGDKAAGSLTINTQVAVFDKFILNMIPVYYNGKEIKTDWVGTDKFSNVVYTDTKLTASYTYTSWGKSTTGTIANCQVLTYEWAELPTSFVVNGNLTFGANAVFTGDITSTLKDAKIVVTEGAKFTNSKEVTTKNVDGSDGSKLTVHNFVEGLGVTAGTKIELLGMSMTLGHWQPTYATGVDLTGNFIMSGLDFKVIPGAGTYTYSGSIWEAPAESTN